MDKGRPRMLQEKMTTSCSSRIDFAKMGGGSVACLKFSVTMWFFFKCRKKYPFRAFIEDSF